ncbi:MAG: class I SAM-dependent methyltransferase [bacterium]|nr:class I SAM-dependent methyltransferase [bacterium]
MRDKTAKKLLKKIKKDYNTISEEFNQSRQSDWKEFKSFLKYIKDEDFIADLGCGNGRFYDFIKEHRKIKYIGIDNSKRLLEHARAKKTKFIHGDLLNLPLDDHDVDVAIAIASLHHIPSKELRKKAIQEMCRILKKKGTLIISNWNLFQPKYKKYIWKARLRHILSLGKYEWRDTFIPWGKSGVKRYYYAFTKKELQKLLTHNGFKIISENIDRNFTFICKKS